jgi:hypothetical protein
MSGSISCTSSSWPSRTPATGPRCWRPWTTGTRGASERPSDLSAFDWRAFQQQYRDHIDLAKLAQLLPVVGAPVGAIVNWRLVEHLGTTAVMAYRMRGEGGERGDTRA